MTPDPTTPAPTRRRTGWLILALAIVTLLAVGAWLYARSQRDIDLRGDITVTASVVSMGTSCTTSGGYADVKAGAQVVITNAAGTVVATATLQPGIGNPASCTFAFQTNVPAGSDFYGVSLSERRGVIQFSASKLRVLGVHLTLGD